MLEERLKKFPNLYVPDEDALDNDLYRTHERP